MLLLALGDTDWCDHLALNVLVGSFLDPLILPLTRLLSIDSALTR